MKILSVVLLAIVGSLVLIASLGSAFNAYSGREERVMIGGVEVRQLAAGREQVVTALEARRGTAAAFAAGFATFFLFVVFGPYKRGDVWAWWAVLGATLVCCLVSAARIMFLGTQQGVGAAGLMLAIVVVALLCDVGRLRRSGAR